MSQATLHTLFLGAVQGLTEFIPVSSDGHLALASLLMDISSSLSFIVWLHLGTLIATLLAFRAEFGALLRTCVDVLRHPQTLSKTPEGKFLLSLIVSTAVTVLVAVPLRNFTAWAESQPVIIGLCFFATGFAVLSTKFARQTQAHISNRQAALIGVAQGLAVLPGLSRSGSTIAMAMALGIRGEEAFRFSFLLAIPTLIGALLLETPNDPRLFELSVANIGSQVLSFGCGLLGIWCVRKLVKRDKLWLFSLYLFPLSLGVILFSSFVK